MFTPHHTAISVTDMKRSVNFYKQFGFTVFHEYSDDAVRITHLKLHDFIMEIFCYSDFKSLPETAQSNHTDLPIVGTKHFALQVNDIDQAKDFCIKNKIELVSDIKKWRTEITYFFFKDPDGILVEIVQDNR